MKNIDAIIAKSLLGTATRNEQEVLQQWVDLDAGNGKILEQITRHWNAEQSRTPGDKERTWEKVQSRLSLLSIDTQIQPETSPLPGSVGANAAGRLSRWLTAFIILIVSALAVATYVVTRSTPEPVKAPQNSSRNL